MAILCYSPSGLPGADAVTVDFRPCSWEPIEPCDNLNGPGETEAGSAGEQPAKG